MCDRNSRKIQELVKEPGNNKCADCSDEGPEYGSFNLGIFLCTTCATFHQKIGAHISKVKSLTLSNWTDDQAEAMQSLGNSEAKKKFEKHIPSYYRIPAPGDPAILIEQCIRAKYERLEFLHVDKQKYNSDSMEDNLLIKKKRDDSSYSPKLFVLAENSNVLSIFSKDSKEAKTSILLARLNAVLSPPKLNMENSMQLTFIDDGVTRHVFVAHERPEVIVDWYMGIRRAKLGTLMRAYPSAKEEELIPYLTHDFAMEGWTSKTGPSENDAYRKRWLTLDNRKLMYHFNPMDEMPRGEIFIGHRSERYSVQEGASTGNKEVGYVFSLLTPERTFVFSVASAGERLLWMNAIRKVIDTEMSLYDIQSRSLLDPGKKRASRHSWLHL